MQQTATPTQEGYALDPAWHAERDRLSSLTSLYDADTLRLSESLGLSEGWRCLDVGAGTGTVAELLADRVGPTGSVLAVDVDTRFLDHLGRANVEVRQADVTAEPLPADGFDLVHTRLVLEHLPARDAALRSMATAVRPGGWILLEEFDWVTAGVVQPPSEVHHRVTDAVLGFLVSRGYDPQYGRKQPGLLRGAGFTDVATHARSVQVHADPERGVPAWELLVDQLAPGLLAQGLVSRDDLDAFHALWHDGVHDCLAPLMMSTWGRRPAR
jgi:SAM-dependent methyltransferase